MKGTLYFCVKNHKESRYICNFAPMNTLVYDQLRHFATYYETSDFLVGDPSWFMHQVRGSDNQEAMAFIASALSYGNRKQFMMRIKDILDWSNGSIDSWVRNGLFNEHFAIDDNSCFYRLYTCATMHKFLIAYQHLLLRYGSLGAYVRERAKTGLEAVEAICLHFNSEGVSGVVPKDAQSACKRVCMFLRWMVRTDSPVDLGLWSDFIDRRTLIMPLDTHVLSQAYRLGLINSKTASMSAAIRLTNVLAEVFPDDPLRGDFALFGYGVNANSSKDTQI